MVPHDLAHCYAQVAEAIYSQQAAVYLINLLNSIFCRRGRSVVIVVIVVIVKGNRWILFYFKIERAESLPHGLLDDMQVALDLTVCQGGQAFDLHETLSFCPPREKLMQNSYWPAEVQTGKN